MTVSEIRPFVRYARALTLDENSSFPAVSIPYDARLFYVTQGEGIIAVDGKRIKMKKESALVINSGVEYSLKAPEGSIKLIAFNFDFISDGKNPTSPVIPATKSGYDPSRLLYHVEFEDENAPKLNRYLFVENAKVIEKKAITLMSEYKKKLLAHSLVTGALMSEIIVDLLRIENTPSSTKEGVIGSILEYIESHYKEPLTNSSVADVFGFHPNYISALIKKTVGMPLYSYLLQVRLHHAAELLESGSFSIGEISAKVGFCDTYHFSHYFKKIMGVAPSAFSKGFK